MGMPRVQESIAEALDASQMGPAAAAREVAKIATGAFTKDDAPVKAVKLRALDMIFRLTVGYVREPREADPAGRTAPDGMFIEGEFADTPPIAAAIQEPKNVTPGKNRQRGRHR